MSDLTGQMLGNYRIENLIGEGGSSIIYRAYQASMERFVAIKVLKADLSHNPDFRERFQREARLVAQLQHPHILPVIDFGQTETIAYLVMMLPEGGSLSQLLRQAGPLPLDRCTQLLTQVASGLEHAHSRGVVHRDIKPANVLLDESGNAYLTDFGVARMMESAQQFTQTGAVIGTPHYLSPEQAMGRPADVRSDIYALGVMVYEMVVGQVPFDSDTPYGLIFQHINDAPPLPTSVDPKVPSSIEPVIMKALEKDPRNRYQTPMEMAEAFVATLPKQPKVSKQDEERAERQPLGSREDAATGSVFVERATETPTITPTRMTSEGKITISNYAGDPRDTIPTMNGFMHFALRAMEEIAGQQATEIILRFAGLEDILDNYPPPDLSLSDTYTFGHYSDLNHAIVNYYGAAGKDAAIHIGRVSARWLVQDQPLFGFASMALRIMPTAAAIRLSFNQFINGIAKLYRKAGIDIHTQILEKPDFFIIAMKECPSCVGKKSNTPICWMWEGLMVEAGALIKRKTFRVEQVACQAMGHPYCAWRFDKKPLD